MPLPRRPVRWEPPRSQGGQARTGQEGGLQKGGRPHTSTPKHSDLSKSHTSTPKHPDLTPAFIPDRCANTQSLPKPAKGVVTSNPPKRPLPHPGSHSVTAERGLKSTRDASESETPRPSKTPKLSKAKWAKPDQGQGTQAASEDAQAQSKAYLTTVMTSDPRVKDAGRISQEERGRILEEASEARALVLTMVYQDGTTQLDPEQVGDAGCLWLH